MTEKNQREKQIKEIAKLIYAGRALNKSPTENAIILYHAGYRKQNEREWVPSADVVPKSEVTEFEIKLRQLEDKLRQYEQVCGKLAIKDGVAVGLIDGKENVYILKSISKVTKELAVRRTKAEVTSKIFEEINRLVNKLLNEKEYSIGDFCWDYEQLKQELLQNN